jgi:hypothetical protein
MLTDQEQLMISELVLDGLYTDGGHHKQWFLQEIGKIVGVELTEEDIEFGIPA